MSYRRYVAIGDSTTEGLQDPYPDGRGFRGWADRLAEMLAAQDPELRYANLAIRGKLARQVHAEQLDAALALRPDLASVLAGLNDLLRPSCEIDAVAAELETMIGAFRSTGADVLAFTLPDPVPVNPLARTAGKRLLVLNQMVREIAARHGAKVVDLGAHSAASDPRLMHPDRLHANEEGHRRIAGAAAEVLRLPGAGPEWAIPLPPAAAVRRHAALGADAVWFGRHVTPWLVRRARGRSSGDGLTAKRPELEPVVP
jgi:lysophospholipase L1-like esterase